MSCVLRQICRILLEKDTKESRRKSTGLAAMADAARATCVGEVRETVVSYIFVRYFRQPYKYDVLSAAVSMVIR
jgi:hypothetical protein